MKLSASIPLRSSVVFTAIVIGADAANVVNFDSTKASSSDAFEHFHFVDRSIHAYGFQVPSDNPPTSDNTPILKEPDGYAYGMGALEQISYDSKEKILYGASEQGYVTLMDYSKGPKNVKQLDVVLPFLDTTLTDVEVCAAKGLLFIATKDGVNNGVVKVFKTAKQPKLATDQSIQADTVVAPEFVRDVEVGVGPDMILANPDCTIIAVANEGEGEYDEMTGLDDPPGSVTLIKEPFVQSAPNVVQVSLDKWTDEELIGKGVHLPLPLNAMVYWDDHSHIADALNFTTVRDNYKSAMNLEPEYLAWSSDGKTVYVNLQENSALVKVNADSGEAMDIYGYSLKDWDTIGIDIVEDEGCNNMPKVPGLSSVRTPDAIALVVVDSETYILTANEGDDKEYGDYEEKMKSKSIFQGNMLGLKDATADKEIFDPSAIWDSQSKYFNSDCDDSIQGWCATSMRMTVGSSMVDYTDATAPHIQKMVAIGARGMSIYKVQSSSLSLVWDSADQFEKEGCKKYGWAHNGIQDEEYAPLYGVLYNTTDSEKVKEAIEEMNGEDGCDDGSGATKACPLGKTVDERSQKDGPAAEAVVVGKACGRLFAVTVSEKNSIGFLYDITTISSPQLKEVFHLSPASKDKNPGEAYSDGDIGEIDSESIIFLSESESPTSRPAIIFAGAWSGTTSFWELECKTLGTRETSGGQIQYPRTIFKIFAAGGILMYAMI